MRVLVACEFSGAVRREFRRRGHDAWSCDLLPAEDRSRFHVRMDVRNMLAPQKSGGTPWDLLIAFPPCTYLAASGLHWNARRPGRDQQTTEALEFVLELLRAPIPRIAIENPVGAISTHIQQPDQIIQPWMFGHNASKATCLWLINLPLLVPTRVLRKRGRYWANQGPTGQSRVGPSEDRWKIRSRTYPGIAHAMAAQWGSVCRSH